MASTNASAFEQSSLMPQATRLQVQGADGRAHNVEYPGLSSEQAVRRAATQGLQVLAVLSSAQAQQPSLQQNHQHFLTGKAGQRPHSFPLVLFSQEMLALLEAGLNLTEALATLLSKERQLHTQAVLDYILRGLREGKNFSDVLATRPQDFPEVYVATVRASERTGDLPQALGRYITYQLQFETLRKKLISAAIYPAMLLIVGGFVALFLLGYVVPKFSAVYESSGRDMPWLSTVLLAFGKTIYQHWQIVLAAVVAVFVSLVLWLRNPRGRMALLNIVLRMPWLALKSQEFRLARFYRAVSLLLASGIALPRALTMVGGMLSPLQQQALAATRLAVDQGQSFSEALQQAELATPVARSLIKVGERSGQMADMLERAAKFHDEDFARWVDWASRLLEPLLMVVIGVVIGAIVVLMYMPIFELAGSLQ
jgi:general secretion pathway protein F